MITKLFRTTLPLIALAPFAVLVIVLVAWAPVLGHAGPSNRIELIASAMGHPGGQQAPRVVKVFLKCESSVIGQHANIQITNNTSNKVPNGTKVYWEINPYTRGSFVLQSLLAPGDSYRLRVEIHGLLAGTDKAWYFK